MKTLSVSVFLVSAFFSQNTMAAQWVCSAGCFWDDHLVTESGHAPTLAGAWQNLQDDCNAWAHGQSTSQLLNSVGHGGSRTVPQSITNGCQMDPAGDDGLSHTWACTANCVIDYVLVGEFQQTMTGTGSTLLGAWTQIEKACRDASLVPSYSRLVRAFRANHWTGSYYYAATPRLNCVMQ